MMIPNLIGVLSLSVLVARITKNYVDRRLHHRTDVAPMLSYDPEIQREQEQAMRAEDEELAAESAATEARK